MSVDLWTYSIPYGKLASKLTILYVRPSFCSNFGPFCRFRSGMLLPPTYDLQSAFWYCFLFAQPLFQSIYWVTVFQMENGPQNLWFRIFYLHFAKILELFTALRASTTYRYLAKYSFGIVSFVQPFSLVILIVTVFQIKNWPQNWRFCIFDHHFAQMLALFAAFRAPTNYLCLAKCIFGIISFAQPSCSVHSQRYNVSHAKLASKSFVLYLWPPFCPFSVGSASLSSHSYSLRDTHSSFFGAIRYYYYYIFISIRIKNIKSYKYLQ